MMIQSALHLADSVNGPLGVGGGGRGDWGWEMVGEVGGGGWEVGRWWG